MNSTVKHVDECLITDVSLWMRMKEISLNCNQLWCNLMVQINANKHVFFHRKFHQLTRFTNNFSLSLCLYLYMNFFFFFFCFHFFHLNWTRFEIESQMQSNRIPESKKLNEYNTFADCLMRFYTIFFSFSCVFFSPNSDY